MSAAARSTILTAGAIAVLFAAPAAAEWRPSKPIEFVATAGPGGGTDNLARTVQSIIVKYKLTDQPVVVVNKGDLAGSDTALRDLRDWYPTVLRTIATTGEGIPELVAAIAEHQQLCDLQGSSACLMRKGAGF